MKADPTDFELSSAKAWLGLRPGMTRAEAMAVITAAGVKTSDDDKDPGWLLVEDDLDMELRFETAGEQQLRQLSRDDDDLTWQGSPIIGAPLHEAWALMQAEMEGAGWSPEDAVSDPMDGSTAAQTQPLTDEQLLHESTLWLPARGLGLVIYNGSVMEVAWRRQQDLPTLVGPVTAAQLNLSKRDDLPQILRKSTGPAVPQARPWTPLQWLIVLVFLGSLATVAKLGFNETIAWQQATILDGKLAALEVLPGKTQATGYRVRYTDPLGKNQQVLLEAADFYVAPREVGEAVQVCYLEGDPPRVKGPSRARDAAFLRYIPWAGGVFLIYIIAMMAAGWLGQKSKVEASSKPPSNGPDGNPPGGPQVKVV